MAEQQRSPLTQIFFSSTQARAVVNRFLLSRVGSVFAAGTPELEHAAHLWHVPILYSPPHFTGTEVGRARVSAITGEMQQHTPVTELRERAATSYERDKTPIHAAFIRARKK